MMRIKKLGICRGAKRAFIKISVSGLAHGGRIRVSAQAPNGSYTPITFYPFDESEHEKVYVLELLLLKIPSTLVTIDCLVGDDCVDSASFIADYGSIKFHSRINYRLHKQDCAQIKECGSKYYATHPESFLFFDNLRYLECGEETVWRFSIEWRGVKDALLRIRVTNTWGDQISVEPLLFEEQNLSEPTAEVVHKRVYYSIRLPGDLGDCILEVFDESAYYLGEYYFLDQQLREKLKYQTWLYMKDARADDENYAKWFHAHRANEATLVTQSAIVFDYSPLISIVTPCFESSEEFLSDLVNSVLSQSYKKWELLLLDASPESEVVKHRVDESSDKRIKYINLGGNEGIVENTNKGIEASKGDFIAFLDHDDLLEPDTLFEYVQCINENPCVQLMYCDEDLFSKKEEYKDPVFKTQLNVDLLYSHNCVTHFMMIKSECLRSIGLSDPCVAGAQDYDLTLRVLEADGEIIHIPRVLYHWRMHEGSTSGDNMNSKSYAEEAGRMALTTHLHRRGINAKVMTTYHPYVYRVKYDLPDPQPSVSIIIPSKDHVEILDDCVKSIINKSTYSNYNILIVENNSTKPETFEYYKTIQNEYACVSVIKWNEEFNYSKIINYGVAHTKSDYALLLNNDTKVISNDFIEEMLGYLQRPEVGVVGAKLYFRDGLTQHAGMLIGPYGAVAHVNQDFSREREGYLGRATRPGNFSSVTGACQMVKRSVFDEVGGYSEELAVGFNDVDFCLKVWKAGYRVVFTPYAELYHYEFVTRGREAVDASKQDRWKNERELFEQTWPEVFLTGDPFTNPNLNRDNFYYALPEM